MAMGEIPNAWKTHMLTSNVVLKPKANSMHFPSLNRLLLALPMLLATTGAAHALSCMRPDIVRSFEQWSTSSAEYLLVRGVLSPTPPGPVPPAPSGDINNPNPPAPHLYRFSGATISRSGNRPWNGDVMVIPTCVAAWCAAHPQGPQEAIMAFKRVGGRYTLEYGPCGGQIFARNLDANEAALRVCLYGRCPDPAGQ